MVLHQLCTQLNLSGYRTGLAIITQGSQANQGFKFGYSSNCEFLDPEGIYYDFFSRKTETEVQEFIYNSIVIYPDIIQGNPLGSKFFCTYVLGIPKFEIISSYIVRFSKLYIEKHDFTLHKSFIDPCMNDKNSTHWSKREMSLTYIGKGKEFLECHTIPDTVLIERDWPKTKMELAVLLRNCKYFYSWDCVSATNSDAILCGAIPVLMHDKQIPRTLLNSGEYGELPIFQSPEFSLKTISDSEQVNIDQMVSSYREKIYDYHQTWEVRVNEFALDIIKRFSTIN